MSRVVNYEEIKNFVQTYLDFSFSLFFLTAKAKLKKHEDLFNSGVGDYPLTYRQRVSAILDEKRNLVIAGAGTGKTTTILAKILYLINDSICKPKDILVLSFGRGIKDEIENKLSKRNIDVRVMTFHKLGLEISKKVDKKPFKISNLCDDFQEEEKLHTFLDETITSLATNNDVFRNNIATYFSEYEISPLYEENELTDDEYLLWLNNHSLHTLNRDWVKSYGEYQIGNYLWVNGYDHEYEKQYTPSDETTDDRDLLKVHKPDFYLNNTNIYIEYFGTDARGNTRSDIDKKNYNNKIIWKRKIHKKGGTKLIELTYADLKSRNLLGKLQDKLDELGLHKTPKDDKEIFKRIKNLNDGKSFQRFTKLIARFLKLYKSKSLNTNLLELNKKAKSNLRSKVFLKIFEDIFDVYQDKLSKENEIDYMDMINNATMHVKNNDYIPKWKYLIIDEFQDFSWQEYALVINLLNKKPNIKLYCVGDDWQSIYSFRGSDYRLMTNFKRWFGVSNVFSSIIGKQATYIKLDETFRFDSMLSYTSSKFILKNKNQLDKDLKSKKQTISPSVILHFSVTAEEWVEKNKNYKQFRGKNLLILYRNRIVAENLDLKAIKKSWNHNGIVRHKTCHQSKGLEDDVVLLIEVKSGNLGFPSDIQDDPVLELVLTERDNYPNAEERRLMYVAMTRARFQTHILCSTFEPSVFAYELQKTDEYKTYVHTNHEKIKDIMDCPMKSCKGFIVNKTRDESKEKFHACTRSPVCKFVAFKCDDGDVSKPPCNGLVEITTDTKGESIGRCQLCSKVYEVCFKCGVGIIRTGKREWKHGKRQWRIFKKPFCHRFPKCR